MQQQDIDRINALANKAKTQPLTPQEQQEQQALRAAYIAAFRQSLKQQLDHTVVLAPDGTRKPLRQKEK